MRFSAMRGRAAALLPLVAVTAVACADDFFVAPASAPAGLALHMSVAQAVTDPATAFDKADAARIRVTGAGVAIDTVVAIAPAAETRVQLELRGAEDGATYNVTVEVRRGPDILFTGTSQATVRTGQATQAPVQLAPVPARMEMPAAVPVAKVIGDTMRLPVAAVFATGDPMAATIAWSSSNTAVATVDATGLIRTLSDGTTTITATAGSVSGSVQLTVLETPARVVRVCATGTGRTFPTLQMAFDSVATNGTIRFCGGTHAVSAVYLPRPVTLEAEAGASATLTGNAQAAALLMWDTTGVPVHGLYSIRNLHFANHGTNAIIPRANALIENVTIDVPAAAQGGIFVQTPVTPGARTIVRNVTIRGGQIGVFAHGEGARIEVTGSRFEGQTATNVQVQTGAGGIVSGNTVDECGRAGCIRARFASDLLVSGNTVRSTARPELGPGGVLALVADGQNVVVRDNLVEGMGPAPNPSDRSSYPIVAGLLVLATTDAPARATFLNNVVRNAASGMVSEMSATGVSAHLIAFDNTVVNAETGVVSLNGATLAVHRNNIGALHPLHTNGPRIAAGSATCNWWGSATGPGQTPSPADVYTPFAEQPIANTNVPCAAPSAPQAPATPAETASRTARSAALPALQRVSPL